MDAKHLQFVLYSAQVDLCHFVEEKTISHDVKLAYACMRAVI